AGEIRIEGDASDGRRGGGGLGRRRFDGSLGVGLVQQHYLHPAAAEQLLEALFNRRPGGQQQEALPVANRVLKLPPFDELIHADRHDFGLSNQRFLRCGGGALAGGGPGGAWRGRWHLRISNSKSEIPFQPGLATQPYVNRTGSRSTARRLPQRAGSLGTGN